MTLATHEDIVDAEVVLTDSDAEDFDTRFQVALGTYAEARQELIDCVEFVRNTNIAERMNFKSRGDYIAARVAGLNVKWAVEDRRSLVELMAYDENGGMSTRQIGNVLGTSDWTVRQDMKESARNLADEPRKVQSSDGITRTYTTNTDWPVVPEPTPEEQLRRFEETRERLVEQGVLPPRRTQEEEDAAADEFVESLVGNRRSTPSETDQRTRHLNAVGELLARNEPINTDGLTANGLRAAQLLGLA